ncbi:MAG: HupE/UreJ family protein, partial [Aestuariivirga sp.]
AMWLVPCAFVGMMAVGGVLGIGGIDLPFVELGIAASVIVLGAAVALQFNLPTVAAMALVGFFAIFHGHAHGAEMPSSAASGLTYALGFMLATAVLHAIGIGSGLGIGRFNRSSSSALARVTGSAMALAGVGILTGYV